MVTQPTGLITKGQLVSQDALARPVLFSLFVVPNSLAAEFAFGELAFVSYGVGEFLAQVEIGANTIKIAAVKAEEGFGMSQVDFVFHPAGTRRAGRVKIIDGDAERFELGKSFGEIGGTVNFFGAAQTEFRARINFALTEGDDFASGAVQGKVMGLEARASGLEVPPRQGL